MLTSWLDSSQASRQKCPAPPLLMQGNSSSSSVDEVMLQRWNGSVWLDLQEHQGGNCQPTRAVEEFEESQPLGIMIFLACKWLRTIDCHRFYHFLDKGAHTRRYIYIDLDTYRKYIFLSRYISHIDKYMSHISRYI